MRLGRQEEPQGHPEEGVRDRSRHCTDQRHNKQTKNKVAIRRRLELVASATEARLTGGEEDGLRVHLVEARQVVQDGRRAGRHGQQRRQRRQLSMPNRCVKT